MSNGFKGVGLIKMALALGVAGATLATAVSPASAGDGGAFAAGLFGGTALGLLAGAAAAPPPPPPPYYYPGAYAPPPPHCWYQPQQIWDGYGYVVQRVRVCN